MRLVNIAIILVLLLLTSSVILDCGPGEVQFPDLELEAVIRELIGKLEGVILPSDLEGITDIGIPLGSGIVISDLTGLEYCTNLNSLWIEVHEINDLSPLAGLTNLTGLWFQYGEINDIVPLAGLTNLTQLYLPDNQISDVSPLALFTIFQTFRLVCSLYQQGIKIRIKKA